MSETVSENLVRLLADNGVTQIFGVPGDALNSVNDAIRRDGRIQWIGTRHEEAAAFAAGAQAALSGRLAVCAGTVGPGAVHLINGLYDAARNGAPVLAITGQVPRAEMGTDYFQEVDLDHLFREVAVYNETIMTPEQMPRLLRMAVHAAVSEKGVAGDHDPRRHRSDEGPRHVRGRSTSTFATTRRGPATTISNRPPRSSTIRSR